MFSESPWMIWGLVKASRADNCDVPGGDVHGDVHVAAGLRPHEAGHTSHIYVYEIADSWLGDWYIADQPILLLKYTYTITQTSVVPCDEIMERDL